MHWHTASRQEIYEYITKSLPAGTSLTRPTPQQPPDVIPFIKRPRNGVHTTSISPSPHVAFGHGMQEHRSLCQHCSMLVCSSPGLHPSRASLSVGWNSLSTWTKLEYDGWRVLGSLAPMKHLTVRGEGFRNASAWIVKTLIIKQNLLSNWAFIEEKYKPKKDGTFVCTANTIPGVHEFESVEAL
jgi:hypothetical protein